jgi:hypothetical protein
MRGFSILGMTFIMLLNLPGWATATTVQFDSNLSSYMQGPKNACAWAFTKAHKNAGAGWQDDHTPANATCTTNGVDKAQSRPQNAKKDHTPNPSDEISASADAQCNPPTTCLSFTTNNPITVISKPHSVAAGTYARGGVPGNSNFVEPEDGRLRGPTVSIVGMVVLSSGNDPYESVFALAITDQDLTEWNSELATLLADPPVRPTHMCVNPPEDFPSAQTDCGGPNNLQRIKFKVPNTIYFQLVIKLNKSGQLHVQKSGPGMMDPMISEQDFEVTSKPCETAQAQLCFTASLKAPELPREIRLMPLDISRHNSPQFRRAYPKQFTIDVVHGVVALPPFE